MNCRSFWRRKLLKKKPLLGFEGTAGGGLHPLLRHFGHGVLALQVISDITGRSNDLSLCSQIVKACNFVSQTSRCHEGDLTFICGKAGVCALGAVVAKHAGDTESLNHCVNQFRMIMLSRNLPSELLYMRLGYLWACLFLNKHLGDNTIPSSSMREVASGVIKNRKSLGGRGTSPLMFEWFNEKYWGAAHGLAGIMHVLMDLDLKADEIDDVKGTLRCMMQNPFQSGNYPASEEDRSRDVLVHWCHGDPGIALTLVKAAKVNAWHKDVSVIVVESDSREACKLYLCNKSMLDRLTGMMMEWNKKLQHSSCT